MSDIVERLRHKRKPGSCFGTMEEAADEIERLRDALQKVADLVDSEGDEPLDDAIAIARRALEAR